MSYSKPRMLFWLLVVVGLGGYGCSATVLTANYVGAKIGPGRQISLQPGENSGNYRNDDLTIAYHYLNSGRELRIWGKVTFASATQLNFNVVDYFNLGLLLGDSQNQILSHHGLVSVSWVNLTGPNDAVHFSRIVKLPTDTSVMAFTYTGQASEGGSGDAEDGGGNTQFWEYPIVK